MSAYFTGTAGYGFGIDYTDEVAAKLINFYEQKTGTQLHREFPGEAKEVFGGVQLFPGVYVESVGMFTSSSPSLVFLLNKSRVSFDKNDTLKPQIFWTAEYANDSDLAEALNIINEFAAIVNAEVGPLIYTELS